MKNQFDFTGKRVVITGGSRGIGLDIARAFTEQGARVAVLGRDGARAEEAAASLGGEARSAALDISDESAVTDTFGTILGDWDGLDILINNAGVTRDKLLPVLKPDDWDSVMATNLRGTYLCSRAALRPMLKQRWGRIINVTSVIGLTGNAGQSNYAASKAGIIGFTKSVAREIASRTVTVNAIAPGLIDTDMTRALKEEQREQILAQIPLGRFGGGEEVAGTALFLASELAGYVTGEVIRVDGGMAM